jgi:hypothetical protein
MFGQVVVLGRYGIELSIGCENTADENMFLNIAECP